MKKVFFCFILVLFSSGFLSAQQKLQIEASLMPGIANSFTQEILYENWDTDAETLSLLEWQNFLSPCIFADANCIFNQHFFLNLNGLYALPFSTGVIQDNDWCNLISTGTKEQTHFSEHKNKTEFYYYISSAIGAAYPLSKSITLKVFFPVKYYFFSFTSTDGYKQYGTKIDEANGNDVFTPWSASIEKMPLEGKIITYQNQDLFFGLGTQVDFNINSRLDLSALIQFQPALKSRGLDIHHRAKERYPYTFFDFSSKLAFTSSFLLKYKILNSGRLCARIEYCFIDTDKSKMYQSRTKSTWVQTANPGAQTQHNLSILLGYTYWYEK